MSSYLKRLAFVAFSCVLIAGPVFGQREMLSTADQSARGRQWLEEGYELYKKKQYADAARFFESGLKLAPNYPDAHLYAAQCYLAIKDEKSALSHALRLARLDPDNPYLAKLKRDLPELEQAIKKSVQAEAARIAEQKSRTQKIQAALKQIQMTFQGQPSCTEKDTYIGSSHHLTVTLDEFRFNADELLTFSTTSNVVDHIRGTDHSVIRESRFDLNDVESWRAVSVVPERNARGGWFELQLSCRTGGNCIQDLNNDGSPLQGFSHIRFCSEPAIDQVIELLLSLRPIPQAPPR